MTRLLLFAMAVTAAATGCADKCSVSGACVFGAYDLAPGDDASDPPVDDAAPTELDLAPPMLPDVTIASDLATPLDAVAPMDLATPPDLAAPHDLTAPCAASLANVGAGDFTIRFRLTTMMQTSAAFLYQRAMCGHGDFWDVYYGGNGTIGAETDDGVSYTNLTSIGAAVNDGKPHDIVVRRLAGTLSIFIDGAPSGSAPSGAALGNLPPLGVAAGNPCQNHPALVQGAVTNICLSIP